MSGTDAGPALCARAAAGGAGAGRQAAPLASPRASAGKAAPCKSLVRFPLQRGGPTLCDPFVLARLIAYPPRCGFPEGGVVTHRGQKQYLVILGSSWVTSYSFHRVVGARGSKLHLCQGMGRSTERWASDTARGRRAISAASWRETPGTRGEALLLVAAPQTCAAGRVGKASAMHPAGRLLPSGFLWPPNPQESRESPAEYSGVCIECEK